MIKAVPYTSLWLGTTLWVLITGGLLAGTGWQLYENYLFSHYSHSVEARVDRKFMSVTHGKGGPTYTPHLDYDYHVGSVVVRAETSVQPDTYNQEREGWMVPVLYVEGEVVNNRIDLPAENQRVWLLTSILIAGSLLFSVSGTCLVIYYLRQNKRYRYLRDRGVSCQGVVTNVPYRLVGKYKTRQYYLTFAFRDSLGEEITGTSWPLKKGQELFWKEGSSIPVYFDGANARSFTVEINRR